MSNFPVAPTLKQLVWALTWMHDLELSEDLQNARRGAPQTPDQVRKYYHSLKKTGYVDRLMDETDTSTEASPVFGEVWTLLGGEPLAWGESEKDYKNPSCCYSYIKYFVGIDMNSNEGEIVTRMAQVTVTGCTDWGGGQRHRDASLCDTKVSLKEILERYPTVLSDILTESNVDLILSCL